MFSSFGVTSQYPPSPSCCSYQKEAGEAFKATVVRNWVHRKEKYLHSFILQMGKGITLILIFGFQLVHLKGKVIPLQARCGPESG